MNETEARAAYAGQIEQAQAAQEALRNPAVMAYFEEAERKAVDAILSVDLRDDLDTLLRLITVAQTVRRMRVFLQEARSAGAFAEDALKQMDNEAEAINGRAKRQRPSPATEPA